MYILLGLLALCTLAGVIWASTRSGRTSLPTPPASRQVSGPDQDDSVEERTARSPRTATPESAAAPPSSAEVTAEPSTGIERPDPVRGRMSRLRARLARSQSGWSKGLLALLSSGALSEETWEEIEAVLLQADLGVEPTQRLIDSLRTRVQVDSVRDAATVRQWLREELLALVDSGHDRSIVSTRQGDRPAVIMVVGVNGAGKTTTVGKLARVLVAEDKDVLLGAADTFRAAAADQLQTWGERVGVPTVRSHKDGADPASVAYEAVQAGQDAEVDVVLIDTAGRLHNKVGLMDELGKVIRVAEKLSPIDEVLLVIDATTGQNGLRQAEVFGEVAKVTGIALTKLDGTAKGGIVVAVQDRLGIPVKLVGLGEGPDDLAPFDAEAFVDAIVDGGSVAG